MLAVFVIIILPPRVWLEAVACCGQFSSDAVCIVPPTRDHTMGTVREVCCTTGVSDRPQVLLYHSLSPTTDTTRQVCLTDPKYCFTTACLQPLTQHDRCVCTDLKSPTTDTTRQVCLTDPKCCFTTACLQPLTQHDRSVSNH